MKPVVVYRVIVNEVLINSNIKYWYFMTLLDLSKAVYYIKKHLEDKNI